MTLRVMKNLKRQASEAIDERIRALYLDGRYSDREIGVALGIHRVTVNRRRIAMGITRDSRPAIEQAAQ